MPLVTVIVPAYNEAENLAALYERLSTVTADELRGSPPFVIHSRLGVEAPDRTDRKPWREEISEQVGEEAIPERRPR